MPLETILAGGAALANVISALMQDERLSPEEKQLIIEQIKNLQQQREVSGRRLDLSKRSEAAMAEAESALKNLPIAQYMTNMAPIIQKAAKGSLNRFAGSASARLGSRSGLTHGAIGNQVVQGLTIPLSNLYETLIRMKNMNWGDIYRQRGALAGV